MDIDNQIKVGLNGKEKCAACEKSIPKDVPRVSFSFKGQYGSMLCKRICGLCILRFAKRLQKNKAIEDWAKVVMIGEL